MKKYIFILLAAASLVACQSTPKSKARKTANPDAEGKASDSYAFGLLFGDNMKIYDVAIDYDEFVKGFKAGIEGKDMAITLESANAMAQAAVQEARRERGDANLAAQEKFLAENKGKKGVITTASGLQYEIISEGSGQLPTATDTVRVDYEGSFLGGKVFDSSLERGEPISIRADQVIPGWTEALQLMKVGSKFKLYVPSSLAYGPEGAGEDIGPNELLIFEVSLLGIEEIPEDGGASDESGEE